MRHVATTVVAAVLGALAALGIANALEPDCPTEDSCTVDYGDGEWTITEVTP